MDIFNRPKALKNVVVITCICIDFINENVVKSSDDFQTNQICIGHSFFAANLQIVNYAKEYSRKTTTYVIMVAKRTIV